MSLLVLLSVLISNSVLVDGQTPCKKVTGRPDQCIELDKCQPLLSTLNVPHPTPQDYETLKKAQCGFNGNTPMVCCPESQPQPTSENKCFTPDNKEGKCISVYTCPHLNRLLQQPLTNAARVFIQNSRCYGPELNSVCCALPKVEPFIPRPTVCTPTALPPEPGTECCGKEGENSNRIMGGSETAIDQYPWLVIIEYLSGTQIKLLCGGVLISGRYVLTAAHCVAGRVLDQGKPTNVRLGEYDISNSGADCMEVEGGGMDCTPGAMVVPIEEMVPHPTYDPNSRLKRNDIALIRLSQMAPYTDFIRPICLPITDVTVSLAPDEKLFTAGWGATDMTTSSSNLKLHVCEAKYNEPQFNMQLWGGQMCAGGVAGKDSCKGDSGGPLMYENRRLFEVIGVVSFGPLPCGQMNVPGVYTKVYEYLPWIRSQIRP
ncbi:unnamed protein product, partial [Iphiclides podalirius]